MAHAEIEPWAAKTLLLLRSNKDNSLDDMRTMLVDAIHTKYHGKKDYKPIPPLFGPNSGVTEKCKTKEPKSSSVEPKSKSYQAGTISPTINLASPNSNISDSDNSSSDHAEMVILEDDSPCVVCKDVTSTRWNQLAECAECHSLYHQTCHVPPIPDAEVKDPRTVWYCRNCIKAVAKPKATSSVGSSSTSTQSSKSSSSAKPARTASPSFGSKTFGGVSVSSKKSSSSKSSSNSSSSKVSSNMNLAQVDKRLQIMKKKAAKKQEKRPK